MNRLFALSAVTLLAILSSFAPVRQHALAAGGSTLTRVEDPVVLTGADVPSLGGIAPGDLVAFRYDAGWVQIPVQVDERDIKTFGAIYNNLLPANFGAITALQYTDAGTFTGADSDPTLDSNDEIVFMANDAGGVPPSWSEPAGVIFNSGVQITVTDPLAAGQTGYVYLFRQNGTLSPGAGQSYVGYAFNLASGAYKTTYNMAANGGNPENSTITSPNYTYHFGDRWQEDQMKISIGGATNVDILDRHKALFSPGYCGRSEDTFDGIIPSSPIEGAFVVNKSGPVRAIRSYVGANSGPLTEREHIFYGRRQDIRTSLRVHAIPSVMDFFDYSPAASGMTYYNDLNTGGVTIDGVPDSPVAGPIQWQMVTGAQGTVVQAASIATNIANFSYTSYYYDQAPAVTTPQCTGDGAFVRFERRLGQHALGYPVHRPGPELHELHEYDERAVLRGAGSDRGVRAGAEQRREDAADVRVATVARPDLGRRHRRGAQPRGTVIPNVIRCGRRARCRCGGRSRVVDETLAPTPPWSCAPTAWP